jgi:hypothetical protein
MNRECRERLAGTYDELTEVAEHRIRALMARREPTAQAMALGVWDLWYAATVGYQHAGDTERLEALFRTNGSPFDHGALDAP